MCKCIQRLREHPEGRAPSARAANNCTTSCVELGPYSVLTNSTLAVSNGSVMPAGWGVDLDDLNRER